MVSKRSIVFGLVSGVLSAAVLAADNGWNYSSGDALPFAGSQQRNEPQVTFRFGSDDHTPRISVDNQKRFDATGNLSIDNDLQQESERCNRVRNQLRSKDANKLNC